MSPRNKPLRTRRWKSGDMQGVTPDELQSMIKVAKDDRHALRNECLLVVGFSFGLRVSELLGLRVSDVDLVNEQIHLERLKHGKVHDPAISKAVARKLKAYIKDAALQPDDILFSGQWKGESKPMSRGYFHKWFRDTAKTAGLPVAKQHPHALRHGLGFALSAAGENVQSIARALGHQTAVMALKFYGSVTDEVADKAKERALAGYSFL